MTFLELKNAVTDFLGVDGKRRGIEAFRLAFIKAAMSDLKFYVVDLEDGVTTYADGDQTPFDMKCAETIAEFVMARIARKERDGGLQQAHEGQYKALRRMLYIRAKEGRYPVLTVFLGKPAAFSVVVTVNSAAMSLAGKVWFTIKRYVSDLDCHALIKLTTDVDGGITITDGSAGKVKVELTADQTALLAPGFEYHWAVQVEDAEHQPFLPRNLMGTIVSRYPTVDENPETP